MLLHTALTFTNVTFLLKFHKWDSTVSILLALLAYVDARVQCREV